MKTLLSLLAALLLSSAALAHTAVEETWTLFSVLATTEADRKDYAYELLTNVKVSEESARAAVKLAQNAELGLIALSKELTASICRDGASLAVDREAAADRLAENEAAFQAFRVEQAEAFKRLVTSAEYDHAIFYVKKNVTTFKQDMDIDIPQLVRDGKIPPAELVELSCPAPDKGEQK